jgi:hypothetical protein
LKQEANDPHARSAASSSRGPPPPSLGEYWPAVALLLLLVAAGVGMGVIAIRHMNALQSDGTTSRYAVVLQVGAPAVIGGALLGFAFVLARRGGRESFAPHPAAGAPGRISRFTVFLVPLVVVAQMAAALLGGASRSAWSTYLLASLIPLVPAAIVGFGALLLSADSEGTRHRGKASSRMTPPADPPDAGLE